MTIETQVVFEYGVIGQVFENKQFSTNQTHWQENSPSYAHFSLKYGLSPICKIIREQPYMPEWTIVFLKSETVGSIYPVSNTFPTEQTISDTLEKCYKVSKSSTARFRLLFYLGALQYHFRHMISAYLSLAENNSIQHMGEYVEDNETFVLKKLCPKWIAQLPVQKLGAYVYSGDQTETIFYEMMSYLTVARTILDLLVRILKIVPTIRVEISQETSFNVLLSKIDKRKDYPLPSCFKELIKENKQRLTDVIEYRDCLLHYEMLSPSIKPYVMIIHTENKLVAIQTWLPDDPRVRSISKYTFEKHIEYLSYAHTTYTQIIEFLNRFLSLVATEMQNSYHNSA